MVKSSPRSREARRERRQRSRNIQEEKRAVREQPKVLRLEEVEKLDINPGYREQFLRMARILAPYEAMANRAKSGDNREQYNALMSVLEHSGVLGEDFIQDVQNLGVAMAETAQQTKRDATSFGRNDAIKGFNLGLVNIGESIAGCPLVAMAWKEAGLKALSVDLQSKIDSGEDILKLRKVQDSTNKSLATALVSKADMVMVDASVDRNSRNTSAAEESWQRLKPVEFEPSVNEEGQLMKTRSLSKNGRELINASVGISSKQKPFELARGYIDFAGHRVVFSVSRLTGEICPVGASVYDFRDVYGATYDVIKKIIWDTIDNAYDAGVFKEKIPESELPSVHVGSFIFALKKCGARLRMQDGQPVFSINGKEQAFWHKGEKVWITDSDIRTFLTALDIRFSDFLNNLPDKVKREFSSRLKRP